MTSNEGGTFSVGMDSDQVKIGTEVVRTGMALWTFLAERSARQRASEKTEVEHRLAIKSELEAHLGPDRADPAAELIIIDAARTDLYPDADDAFRWGRLSPWFKTEGWAFYGNGLEVGSNSAQRIKIRGSKARIVRKGGDYMVPVGRIPFTSIIATDWGQDLRRLRHFVFGLFHPDQEWKVTNCFNELLNQSIQGAVHGDQRVSVESWVIVLDLRSGQLGSLPMNLKLIFRLLIATLSVEALLLSLQTWLQLV
jgi:hypothetical protein